MKKTYIFLLALSFITLGFSQTNLVSNGTFDDATDLTFDTEWTISGGTANFDDLGESKVLTFALSEDIIVGETYNLTFDVVSTNLGDARIGIWAGTRFDEQMNAPTPNYGVGTISFNYTHTVADRSILTFAASNSAGGGEFSIDNVVLENIIKTLVTVDRPNITGPTDTDNVASISSVGLTRGSGVAQSTTNTNFTSRNWPLGGDQPTAAAGDDFIQWSITANTAFEITLDELDIRLRRNATGPTSFQIFYSLDNFATAGTALDTSKTLASLTTTPFNTSSLTVTSGISGTITFRLYAWGSTANAGWLRVIGNTAWASPLAITNPGVRIVGSVATTSTNSIESDIIASSHGFFPVQSNIDYNST
jgi:hypothetical protein